MAIDDVRIRARQRLEELIGVEEAAYVVSDRPPGGWDALVTKEHLGLEAAALRHEITASRHEVLARLETELRAQTRWLATLVVSALAVVVAATAAIGTLLRFA